MTSHLMQDDTVWPQTVPGSLPGAWHGPRLFLATRVFCRQIVYNCSQFVDKKAFTGFSHYSPPGSPRLWPEPGPSVAKAQNQSAPPLGGPDAVAGARLDMNQMSWHESMFRAQLKPLSCY